VMIAYVGRPLMPLQPSCQELTSQL